MPKFKPTTRKKLIRCLEKLGFEGPYSGGKHQYMIKKDCRLTLPNPHENDISQSLLGRILRQAKISKDEWENL
jgi:predicted RNA binding protein YcfA (HicA-like mRNA interferase family)